MTRLLARLAVPLVFASVRTGSLGAVALASAPWNGTCGSGELCIFYNSDFDGPLAPEVNAALVTMSDHTLDNCLGRDDAIRYVRSTLDALGERGYEIRTDGMLAAPADRWDDAKRQFDAGCYVFSGTGRTADGTAVFFLTGD